MSRHLRVTVRTFDFCRHVGEIHVLRPDGGDRVPPPIVFSSAPYALVPEGELEAAFASLQDAGEAAGCPVGMDIMNFIGGQRSFLAELVSMVGVLCDPEMPPSEIAAAKTKAELMVENYKAVRQ